MTRRALLFASVALLCALPAILIATGMEVATGAAAHKDLLLQALSGKPLDQWDYGMVRGATAYSLLEWTVAVLATATAVFCYAHFHERREALSMLVSIAAFWIAAITGFQLLAFHGFSMSVTNLRDFVHFNWTLSQTFVAVLILGTSGLVQWRGRQQKWLDGRRLVVVVAAISAVAYGLIVLTSRAPHLPAVIRADALISRPMELVSFVLFAIAAVVALPLLHRRCQTTFSLALWLSAVPLVASQIYMGFFSVQLFDAGFTAAQLNKTLAFGIVFAGLAFDYAHTCRNEDRLRHRLSISDRRIRMLFDNAAEAIVIFDEKRQIRSWNRRACEIFGASAEEAGGEDVLDVLFGDDEERKRREREQFCHRLREFRQSEDAETLRQLRELTVRGDDGEEMTVEYSIVSAATQEGGVFAVLARDVSQRRRLQRRMSQVDRLVAVGTLAAGVVHEIKNPLTYVTSNITLARESLRDLDAILDAEEGIKDRRELLSEVTEYHEEVDEMLQASGRGCERIRRIIEDMRTLSQGRPGQVEPVSVVRAVEVALRMTRSEIRRITRVETCFDDVALVDADETQLSQVFVNLIMNASQAMAECPDDDQVLFIEVRNRGEDHVVAHFEDTGPGISETVQSRIFQPFFTTKPVGVGTGLGLSLSKSIIEGFDGDICVESTPGQGAVFEVILPVSKARRDGQ